MFSSPDSCGTLRAFFPMSRFLTLSCHDRLLVLAPHPDDETLATGGLIQKAVAAGAAVRVVLATDGDDNPWPQRALERRWRIAPADRTRWGATRRCEALAALACLGVEAEGAAFLALPDQGITRLLMAGDDAPCAALHSAIAAWRPTVLALPSGADRHPDHSALWVFAQMALARMPRGEWPRRLEYLVHTRERDRPAVRVRIPVDADARHAKRAGILCHATQMALSRRRFLAYDREFEDFHAPSSSARHPIVRAECARGVVRMRVKLPRRISPLGKSALLLAFESAHEGGARWTLPLPAGSGVALVRDAATGRVVRKAAVRAVGRWAEIAVSVACLRSATQAFVKLSSPVIFLDAAGWREITLPSAVELPEVEPAAESRRTAYGMA